MTNISHAFLSKCLVNKSGFKPESVLNLEFINIRHILRHGGRRSIYRMDFNLYLYKVRMRFQLPIQDYIVAMSQSTGCSCVLIEISD